MRYPEKYLQMTAARSLRRTMTIQANMSGVASDAAKSRAHFKITPATAPLRRHSTNSATATTRLPLIEFAPENSNTDFEKRPEGAYGTLNVENFTRSSGKRQLASASGGLYLVAIA